MNLPGFIQQTTVPRESTAGDVPEQHREEFQEKDTLGGYRHDWDKTAVYKQVGLVSFSSASLAVSPLRPSNTRCRLEIFEIVVRAAAAVPREALERAGKLDEFYEKPRAKMNVGDLVRV